jgi:hypothetical protein
MPFIAMISKIGLIADDNAHTVAYRKSLMSFVGANGEESRVVPEGHYKQSVGDTEAQAFQLLAIQVKEEAERRKIDPKDLWISMVSVETEDGLFWPLRDQTTGRRWRVSDMEII